MRRKRRKRRSRRSKRGGEDEEERLHCQLLLRLGTSATAPPGQASTRIVRSITWMVVSSSHEPGILRRSEATDTGEN